MKKLYDKDQVMFAVLWIAVYCVLTIPIRGNYGDDSPLMTIALIFIAVMVTGFIKKYKLEEKYGLAGWPSHAGRYLYFIPMWFLATGNLWSGFSIAYRGIGQFYAVVSMVLIGYVEEIIFRGFLFKGMLEKDGEKAAIIVSSVTFGIGHILNLFAGVPSFIAVLDVIFAIALGFVFTLAFYKSGSLLPCIIMHALVDVFSKFGELTDTTGIVYVSISILVSIAYCFFLLRNSRSQMRNE